MRPRGHFRPLLQRPGVSLLESHGLRIPTQPSVPKVHVFVTLSLASLPRDFPRLLTESSQRHFDRRWDHHSYFPHVEIEAQRRLWFCAVSHSKVMAQLRPGTGHCGQQ